MKRQKKTFIETNSGPTHLSHPQKTVYNLHVESTMLQESLEGYAEAWNWEWT